MQIEEKKHEKAIEFRFFYQIQKVEWVSQTREHTQSLKLESNLNANYSVIHFFSTSPCLRLGSTPSPCRARQSFFNFHKTLKHRITLFLLFLLSGAHSFASFIFSFGFNVIITLQFLIEVSSSRVSISIGFAGSSVLPLPPLLLLMLTHVKFTYTRIYIDVTQYRQHFMFEHRHPMLSRSPY